MTKATLKRIKHGDHGTFGIFRYSNFVCYSAELPPRDNKPSISCIPTGTYLAQMTYSPRFKRMMILVENVPQRSGIRIHSANFAGDKEKGYKCQLNGCISLGLKLGTMDGQQAVLLSAPAVRQLETLVGEKPFKLEIKDA